jgi:hypothetical protein
MSIIALNNTEHQALKIDPRYVLKYMAEVHMVPVIVHECAFVGSDAPVVFVKNQDTGQFQMVVLYGLEPGENVFARNGEWNALSLPLVVQCMPLKLLSDGDDSDRMMIGIDDTSPFINGEEGEVLFDANGEETDFLKSRKELLGQYFEGGRVTQAFIDLLSELNLLAKQDIKINADGEKIDIAGLYSVDEGKLRELSTEDFEKIRTSGFLPVVYAQLMSMNQIRRLTRLRAKA